MKIVSKYLFSVLTILALFYLYFPNGMALSPDSKQYVYAAYSFENSFTFREINNSIFMTWPIGYSFLIYLISKIGTLAIFLPIFSALLAGTNTFICIGIVEKMEFDIEKGIYFLLCFFISLIVPIVHNYYFVWSEGVFIVLLNAAFLFSISYIIIKKNSYLFISVGLLSVLPLFRYVGIIHLLLFILFFIYTNNRIKTIHTIRLYLILAISFIPFLLFLSRNYYYTTEILGERLLNTLSFAERLKLAINAIFATFLPFSFQLGYLFFALFILLAFYYLSKNQNLVFSLFTINAFVYFGFIVFISRSDFDERIFSPIVFPTFIILLTLIVYFNKKYSHIWFLKYLLIVFMIYPIFRNVKNISDMKKYSVGYEFLKDYKPNFSIETH